MINSKLSSFRKFFTQISSYALISFFVIAVILPTTTKADITQETVCKWMNNQSGSFKSDGPATPSDPALNKKIYALTEEPLGSPDNKDFSFRCVRRTHCFLDPKSKGLRKCTVTYEPTCTGTPTPDNELNTKMGDPNSDYTICENVQVLIADGGTDMLFKYIGLIYRYMVGLGSILAVLMIIIAGILRAAAGDNSEMLAKSKKMMTQTIIGLIILLLSAVILYTINPNFFVVK